MARYDAGLKNARFGLTTFGSLEELEARSWSELVAVPHDATVLSAQLVKGTEHWREGELTRYQPHRDVAVEVCMSAPAIPDSARYVALLWFSRNDLAVWQIDE